jgi:hypothetical protein
MKRKILLVIVLLIVVAGIIGYRLYSKKVENYAEGEPDITVTAKELVTAFERDTASAVKQYLDKKVRVSGIVKSVDASAVVLGEEGNPSDVVVGLDDRNLDGISLIKVGETAILQGKFSGYNQASGDSNDLISSLGGTTIKIDYAGIKNKN